MEQEDPKNKITIYVAALLLLVIFLVGVGFLVFFSPEVRFYLSNGAHF